MEEKAQIHKQKAWKKKVFQNASKTQKIFTHRDVFSDVGEFLLGFLGNPGVAQFQAGYLRQSLLHFLLLGGKIKACRFELRRRRECECYGCKRFADATNEV